jgi:hypothetical protein
MFGVGPHYGVKRPDEIRTRDLSGQSLGQKIERRVRIIAPVQICVGGLQPRIVFGDFEYPSRRAGQGAGSGREISN